MEKLQTANELLERFKTYSEGKLKEDAKIELNYSLKIYLLSKVVMDKHPLITNPKNQFLFELNLDDWMFNLAGNVHGGVVAMIVHSCTNLAILA